MRLVIKRRKCRDQSDKDFFLSRFICMYILLDALNSVLQDVFGVSGTPLTAFKIAAAAFLFLLMLKLLLKFTGAEWTRLLGLELFVLFLYLYSLVDGVPFSRLAGWAGTSLAVCVPLAVVVSCIEDRSVLYSMLVKYSWFVLALLAVNMAGRAGDLYDMHFSYALLLVMLLHLNELINRGKKLYIVFLLAELVMLVLYGSRGALACVVVFLFLKVFTNVENRRRRYLYVFLIVLGSALVYGILSQGAAIYRYFLDRGVRSRTLYLFLTGQFMSHDSGRNELWMSVVGAIRERPLAGWGIRGATSFMQGHPYPHQFFLDMLVSFGLPLGLLLIVLSIWPIRRVFTEEKSVNKDLLQILFCSSFVMLMFSSTWFTNDFYYMLLGLLVTRGRLSLRRRPGYVGERRNAI